MLKLLTATAAVALLAGTAQAQSVGLGVQTPAIGAQVQTPVAGAQVQTPAVGAQVQAEGQADASSEPMTGAFSDTQLTAFAQAMTRIRTIVPQGSSPTAEQQTEIAAVVESSGLDSERFNAISTAVSSDAALRARLGVLEAPASPAGSVAAGVTDAEVEQFSSTMARIRAIGAGAQPTAEQQAEMAAAVEASGLTLDRFNAISTAVSTDAQLRAKVELADAERGGE